MCCDILGCTPAELVVTTAENTGVRKTATDDQPAPRPQRSRGPARPGSCPTNEPPYATDEQYARWYLVECCRCGRRRNRAGSWPDGPVCRTCHDRALRRRGHCPGCGTDRVLPGLRAGDQSWICSACAGFTASLRCRRRGEEGKPRRGKLGTRCTLDDRLHELLATPPATSARNSLRSRRRCWTRRSRCRS